MYESFLYFKNFIYGIIQYALFYGNFFLFEVDLRELLISKFQSKPQCVFIYSCLCDAKDCLELSSCPPLPLYPAFWCRWIFSLDIQKELWPPSIPQASNWWVRRFKSNPYKQHPKPRLSHPSWFTISSIKIFLYC